MVTMRGAILGAHEEARTDGHTLGRFKHSLESSRPVADARCTKCGAEIRADPYNPTGITCYGEALWRKCPND